MKNKLLVYLCILNLLSTTLLTIYTYRKIHILEYALNKLSRESARNSANSRRNSADIKSLQDRRTTRFLRLNNEATFYKGCEIEVWKVTSK